MDSHVYRFLFCFNYTTNNNSNNNNNNADAISTKHANKGSFHDLNMAVLVQELVEACCCCTVVLLLLLLLLLLYCCCCGDVGYYGYCGAGSLAVTVAVVGDDFSEIRANGRCSDWNLG